MGEANKKISVDSLKCMIDLHLHADGAISPKSARRLAELSGIRLDISDSELLKLLQVSPDCRDLNEFLEKFEFPCLLLQTKASVEEAFYNLCNELKDQGVMYAELRFAPQKSTEKGLTQRQAVEAALKGMKRTGLESRLILCAMRGDNLEEANLETVLLAGEFLDKGVCAVDLAGAEALFKTKNYGAIFKVAREKGIPFTIHAGEADGPDSVRTALEFGAARIGHGVRALEDKALVERLAKDKIPLELCPTSNLNTCIYKSISEYPIRKLMGAGVVCTVNTDDPSVEGTDIKSEYRLLMDEFHLTAAEVKGLLLNSVGAAFADNSVKVRLIEKINMEFKEYE